MLYLPWKFQKSRVLNCKLRSDHYLLNSIREWIILQEPSTTTSTHKWYKDLPQDIKEMFYNTAKDKKIIEMFRRLFGASGYKIDILHDMNEIYVSPPSNNNKDFEKNASDNIFYTRHIDGPFFYIPFASCYRVIIGLDDNRDIMTIFNMTPETYIIKTGDVVGFDFHRECHYISPIIWNTDAKAADTLATQEKKYRVILKIHYCVYPYWAIVFGFILGKLTILYNKLFRDLFLLTIRPRNKCTRYLAKLMVISTQAYHDIEFYIGYNNIQYLVILYYISSNLHANLFLFGSSFVHYLRWIDTQNYSSEVNNIFRRDYYFFKFLYMLQYFYMYFSYKLGSGGNGSYGDDWSPVIYTVITVPPLLASCVYNFSPFISKIIEMFLAYDMLNNYSLAYTEYIYIYINIFLNYIQLRKPIAMTI
uniref:Uncharacterized protein n=1 Tax=viral metagenome TaxID=1070528 RepID=A0A6C0CFD1_9ZZZZ